MSSCCSCNNLDIKGSIESAEESEEKSYEAYGGTSTDIIEESEENTSEVDGTAKKPDRISWRKRFRSAKIKGIK